MKNTLKLLLRRMHLLKAADYLLFFINILKNYRDNQAFLKNNPHFAVPPLSVSYDALNTVNLKVINDRGLKVANIVAQLINKYLPNVSEKNIFEWGCGPARIIRHLPSILGNQNKYYGSDYNLKSIDWCQKSLKEINFIPNGLTPPINFNDNSFDIIYSFSVFTHLSEKLNYDWLNELIRILKPNGLLIITTNGDYFRDIDLLVDEKKKYDEGNIVIRGEIKEGKKWFTAFHSPMFVRNNFLNKMEILEHIPGTMAQDIWVSRKP